MQLIETGIYDDILKVISNNKAASSIRRTYELSITANKQQIDVNIVWDIDITRDFIRSYADHMTMGISVSRYQFDKLIYPNRNNLLGVLRVTSVDPNMGQLDLSQTAVREFRIKLTDDKEDAFIYGEQIGFNDSDKQYDLKSFNIQLIPLELEIFRMKTVSGVIRDTNPTDLLEFMLASTLTPREAYPEISTIFQSITETEEYDGIPVDMWSADRVTPIGQLIIPDGLDLCELPAYMQKFGGGIYNHNLGFYILHGWAHIYPIFLTDYLIGRRSLTILFAGRGKYNGLESTYIVDNTNISIVASDILELKDTKESSHANLGNAVKFSSPNFNDGDIDNSVNDKTVYNNNISVVGNVNPQGNNVKVHSRVTDNPFYEISRLAGTGGTYASFAWENCNSALIMPNTQIRVLYKNGDRIYERFGVIVGFDFKSQKIKGDGNKSHVGKGVIHCYLK